MTVLRYCRAYPAAEVGRFAPLRDWLDRHPTCDEVVYVWDDLRVGVDPFDPDERQAVDDATWPAFCQRELGFAVPYKEN